MPVPDQGDNSDRGDRSEERDRSQAGDPRIKYYSTVQQRKSIPSRNAQTAKLAGAAKKVTECTSCAAERKAAIQS